MQPPGQRSGILNKGQALSGQMLDAVWVNARRPSGQPLGKIVYFRPPPLRDHLNFILFALNCTHNWSQMLHALCEAALGKLMGNCMISNCRINEIINYSLHYLPEVAHKPVNVNKIIAFYCRKT